MAQPASMPDRRTVRSSQPPVAATVFTTSAGARLAATASAWPAHAPAVTRLQSQRTAPAVAGTEILSSSAIGTVSTSPAATAASTGATTMNASAGGGVMAGAVHQAKNTAAAPPAAMNASRPSTLLSGFQASRWRPQRRPASVAAPSPRARMPHALAAMSSLAGNARIRNSTLTG